MIIYINSRPESIPAGIDTVAKVMEYLKISIHGTGVGLNGRLIPSKNWESTKLKEDDRLMVISAAYGG